MNHEKVYNLIIQKATSENRIKHNGAYYENHHIIPKCVGGINSKENLILLTAKEHYICHELLTYIYPKNRNLAVALMRMSGYRTKYKVSARDYARAKENLSNTAISKETRDKLSNVWKDRKHTTTSKEKMREQKLGEKNPMFGKISPNKGKTYSFTEQQRKNLSKSMEGKSPKINSMKKECEYCHKSFTIPCYKHWHGERCKIKNQIIIIL
jgi:hypothetical protein